MTRKLPKLRTASLRTTPNRNSELLTGALAVACMFSAGVAHGQATDAEVIILPSVDVETTAVKPVKATRRATVRKTTTTKTARRVVKPVVCTPELTGTPVCAAEDAEAARVAEAEAAEAARQASAGSNPNADPNAAFKVDTLSGNKTPGKLLDTSRTVYTISKEVLETTATTSVRQLARSTPGISLGFGEGGNAFGDNLYIRGFKANNDIFVDGVRDPSVGVRENFMTEQVEIFKGPSATVGGRGTTGGALNISTKKPSDLSFQRYTATVGNAGLKRGTFDVNFAVDERLQFRLGAMVQESGVAGRDYVKDNRSGLSIAAQYALTDDLSVTVDYYHLEMDQTPDWGVPFSTDAGLPVSELGIDRSTFYGVRGRDFQTATQDVGTVTAKWELGENLTLTNTLRASKSVNDYILSGPEGLTTNGSTNPEDWTVRLAFKSQYQTTDTVANVTELVGEGHLGGMQHNYTFGASIDKIDISKVGYDGLTSESYQAPAGTRGCTVSAVNPDAVAEGCWIGETPVRGTSPTYTTVKTKAVYALDTITLSPSWILNGGVRVDWYDIQRSGVDGRSGEAFSLSRKDTLINWNAGVTYKPRENLSFYAAASTSSNPMGSELAAGGGFYGGLDDGGSLLKPEKSTSFELGAKYELYDNLLLSAALFQTTKSNAREDSGGRGQPQVTSDSGEYRIRGIELSVAGKVADRINLFGGAVFMQSEILKSSSEEAIGQEFPNIAHQSFNLLATYDVSDRLMIGAQANYAGKVKLGSLSPNGNTLPSHWTFDLVGEYELTKSTALKFNVKNVADTTYYDAAYRSGSPFVYVAPGREISVTLDMKF